MTLLKFSETGRKDRYNVIVNIFKNKLKGLSIADVGIKEENNKTSIHIKGVFSIFISEYFVFFTIYKRDLSPQQFESVKSFEKKINLSNIPTDDLRKVFEKEARETLKYVRLIK